MCSYVFIKKFEKKIKCFGNFFLNYSKMKNKLYHWNRLAETSRMVYMDVKNYWLKIRRGTSAGTWGGGSLTDRELCGDLSRTSVWESQRGGLSDPPGGSYNKCGGRVGELIETIFGFGRWQIEKWGRSSCRLSRTSSEKVSDGAYYLWRPRWYMNTP